MSLLADIATGATVLCAEDLRLPGLRPMVLARGYRSDHAAVRGLFGNGWAFNWDITLHVERDRIRLVTGDGRETVFKPITVGMQARLEDSGYVIEHHPDAYVAYRTPRRKQVFLKRNASGNVLPLDRLEDLSGNHFQFARQNGRLTMLADTLGRRIAFQYGGEVISAIQVTPAGGGGPVTVQTFRYDAQGDLIGVADALRREERYAYQKHLMVNHTNRLGGSRFAQYADDGRCTALWNNDGSGVRLLDYDDLRQTTRIVNTLGEQALYRHSEKTQVLSQVDPLGESQYFYYDKALHLTGYSVEGGGVATIQNVADGALMQADGEERVAFLQYNDEGLLESVAGALENTSTLGYDEAQNLTLYRCPGGAMWTFERDKRGRVIRVTSPEGRWVSRTHGDRTVTVEDDVGPLHTDTYDGLGRLTARAMSGERRRQYQYDAGGRLIAVSVDGGYNVKFGYNAAGLLDTVSDTEGLRATMRYEAFGRLTAATDTHGDRWTFDYDPDGRLTAARVQGLSTRFGYDWQGRVVEYTGFDGRTRQFEYDEDGKTVRSPDGERVFDLLHELVKETEAGRTVRQCSYGPSGELLDAEVDGRNLSFTYDGEVRLLTVGDGTHTLARSYDRDGNLIGLDAGEVSYAFAYDARNRLVGLTREEADVARLEYDASDRCTRLVEGDGGEIAFSYDVLDRLTESRRQRPAGPSSVRYRAGGPPVIDGVGGAAEGDEIGLVLHQQGLALVLLARLGTLTMPVWRQDAGPSPAKCGRVAVCLYGEDALRMASPRDPCDLLQYWQPAIEENTTNLPSAAALGRMGSILDRFFLSPAHFDLYHVADPGMLPRHQADRNRGPDPLVTGGHLSAPLRPRVWREVAAEMNHTFPTPRKGGLEPADVFALIEA